MHSSLLCTQQIQKKTKCLLSNKSKKEKVGTQLRSNNYKIHELAYTAKIYIYL